MEMSKTLAQIKAYARRQNLPIIPIVAKDVSLLQEPITFYETLLAKTRGAKERVALSALYIGTGPKEEALLQTLNENLEKNPNLSVSIALDANRAKRTDPLGRSSVSALQGVLVHKTAKLNLVQTRPVSGIIQGLLSQFQKWNELSSTYHTKLMVFDNDVIITGANLSSIYFERRQDRYMTISDSRHLSDYICGFLSDLNNKNGQSLNKIVQAYNDRYISASQESVNQDTDCYIIPIFQCRPQNLQACDDFLEFLDQTLPEQARIHLSSGYFNPTLKVRFSSVLAPSEEANGFFNGGGLLRFVPRLYAAIMRQYLNRNPKCELHLYKRPGWSYHAKGLWFEGSNDLCIHMIGSSNFNSRSSERDFELQFLILTTNSDLSRSLDVERADLLKNSTQVGLNSEWKLNPIYELAAKILKSLL